jgi:hypothetical protein
MKRDFLNKNIKPHFAGHETFHLRYGWLKKAYDEVNRATENTRKVFTDDEAIATFGVGKNMVAAIRFWSKSCGIIESELSETNVTKLGKCIFDDKGLDPYLENPTSLWMLHWKLASDPNHTTIFWLFNYFNGGSFDKDLLARNIIDASVGFGWSKPNKKTLNSDLLVLLNTYAMNATPKKSPKEDSLTSPLAELGLIRRGTDDRFHMGWGTKPSLTKGVFMYALCDFWNNFPDANTLNFQNILLDPGSPGRIFVLDENELAVRLMEIEKDTAGLIRWSETAGLKQLIRSETISDEKMLGFFENDYNSVQLRKEVA